MAPALVTLLVAAGLAAVHVVAGRLRVLRVVPRSRWLSFAGGVSVAYVFVHLLPEIATRQARVAGDGGSVHWIVAVTREQFLFVVALAGFALFYGLENLARRSRAETGPASVAGAAETGTAAGVFWIHVGSFGAYNALVGYLLLHREETGTAALVLFGTAMGLHFLVNDYGLSEHHREAYERVGRWLLSGAVLLGVAVGYLVAVRELFVSLLLAFLAGGVVLNVIKEELPAERESRFPAFGAGLAVYTVVLLLA